MKYVFISGASSDLGKSIANIFASNNFNLILGYNKNEEKKVLSEETAFIMRYFRIRYSS